MQKERLWTKDFISITVVNFVLMLSMYLLLVTMATYTTETYNASASTAGLVASIFIIGSLIGRLFGGKQIAKVGSKKMLITGIIIFSIVTVFYFVPTNLYVLILIRLLHGIGVGLATTATGTIVSQVIPPSRSGEGISYFSLSAVLSTAIGPLIGLALIASFGYTSIFIFSLVMGIFSLLLALPVRAPQIKYVANSESTGFKFSSFFESKAMPVSIAMLVMALAYSGILSFITTYAADIDLVKAGSFYFLVYAVIILISRPFTGKMLDSRGGNSVAYPALVLFAIGMLLLSQAHSSFIFLLAAAFIGLGYGNFQSTTQALAIKVTPPHRMGLANSTYFIFLDLGLGLGPFLLGYLVPVIGYRGLYLSLVALIVIGIFVYYALHGKRDKEILQS
ncbi:MFS transporter [Psychrobacillus lasiicapitis]|uniref:MFS transporter n=1 Tax=Psychrobacillus lasiicapitis TaxID=1636719 RepID=A0A544T4R1_9BACI|nr:MFS transporter [Psychrobacillus lasiicapitis]TQR12437.1 MFS transporter [Psychrobacillus lasiicapitis]GGA38108.1 MFS transporter [Psychrobacillus lasiicapitis]